MGGGFRRFTAEWSVPIAVTVAILGYRSYWRWRRLCRLEYEIRIARRRGEGGEESGARGFVYHEDSGLTIYKSTSHGSSRRGFLTPYAARWSGEGPNDTGASSKQLHEHETMIQTQVQHMCQRTMTPAESASVCIYSLRSEYTTSLTGRFSATAVVSTPATTLTTTDAMARGNVSISYRIIVPKKRANLALRITMHG